MILEAESFQWEIQEIPFNNILYLEFASNWWENLLWICVYAIIKLFSNEILISFFFF